MGFIIRMRDDNDFENAVQHNRDTLIVAYIISSYWYTAHQQEITTRFEELSVNYYKALFLRVELERCAKVNAALEKEHSPKFTLYFNNVVLESMLGDNADVLETKILKYYRQFMNADGLSLANLRPFIRSASYSHYPEHVTELWPPISDIQQLTHKWCVKSADSDPRLIIAISFSRIVHVHLLQIEAPVGCGPTKKMKLFVNHPQINFNMDIENLEATTEVQLTKNQLRGACHILSHPALLNVSTLQIVINRALPKVRQTKIDDINFYGL